MNVRVVVGVMLLRNPHLDFLCSLENLVGGSEGWIVEGEGEARDMVCKALRRRRVIPEERKK